MSLIKRLLFFLASLGFFAVFVRVALVGLLLLVDVTSGSRKAYGDFGLAVGQLDLLQLYLLFKVLDVGSKLVTADVAVVLVLQRVSRSFASFDYSC